MNTITYIVREGDTINTIAARYNVAPQELIQVNAIHDPDMIWIGQELEISAQEPQTNSSLLSETPQSINGVSSHSKMCSAPFPSLEQLLNANVAAENEQSGPPNQCIQPCTIQSPCQVRGMIVSCGHASRRFKLEVPEDESEPQGGYILEVIAGEDDNKAEELKIEFGGSCGRGMSSISPLSTDVTRNIRPNEAGCCPAVIVSGPDVQVEQPNPVNVRVYAASPPSIREDFKIFLQQILIPYSVERKTYQIIPKSCLGPNTPVVKINTYPQVEWEGALSIGYFHTPHKDSNFNRSQGYQKLKVNGEWNVEGKITAKYALHTWEWGGDIDGQGVHQKNNQITRQLFARAQGFLNSVTPFLGSIKTKYASIEIKWPKLTLSGSMKNYEKPDSYEVDIEGSIKVGFSPLIGAEFKTDILEWLLLMSSGPLSKFLSEVKASAAKEIGEDKAVGGRAVVFIYLKVEGNVGGTMEWKKTDNWSCQGSIEAGLGFEIEAKVELEGKVFLVVAGAGASIAMKGSDRKKSSITGKLTATDADGQPGTQGKIDFNGLAIFYCLYAYVGLKETKTDSSMHIKKRKKQNIYGAANSSKAKNERKEEKLLVELCKPKTLFDTNGQIV